MNKFTIRAAEWLGRSTLVAQKHYWQVTDADFDRASGPASTAASTPTETHDAESEARVVNALNEAEFADLATDSDLAKIAAMWVKLSPTARGCMMLLIRNS